MTTRLGGQDLLAKITRLLALQSACKNKRAVQKLSKKLGPLLGPVRRSP